MFTFTVSKGCPSCLKYILEVFIEMHVSLIFDKYSKLLKILALFMKYIWPKSTLIFLHYFAKICKNFQVLSKLLEKAQK